MRRVISRLILWLAAAAVVALPAAVGATLTTSGTPEVKFEAHATAGLTIVGTTHDLTVIDDGTQVTVRVPLRRLTTGIELRDRHMKEHLDTAHFRTAELVVKRQALQVPAQGTASATARGIVRLKGEAHQVSFRYTAEHRGDAIRVRGTTRIDMTQFGIEPPSYLGMSVQPGVQVTASFAVQDR